MVDSFFFSIMKDNTKYASLLNYCNALKATITDRDEENSKLRAEIKVLREQLDQDAQKRERKLRDENSRLRKEIQTAWDAYWKLLNEPN